MHVSWREAFFALSGVFICALTLNPTPGSGSLDSFAHELLEHSAALIIHPTDAFWSTYYVLGIALPLGT